MASHLLEKMVQDGTNSLRERVYRHLEAALREGRLHHGTCLDQDRLCEELGVSRTPLRDALLRLEAEGFVTIQPRKGVYITPVSDAFVKSACQILGALEADCLDIVFPLLTSRHIRQLEESNKRQEQFLERRQALEYHAENARFHDIFLSLSSNTLLHQTIGPLRRRLDMLPDHPLAYDQARAALNDHSRIIDSLK
uniref:GntR family transcriptional regulator n=1 Tax=uncultured Bilophila sp. TaxID=529385 RepID=UPI00280BF6D5